MADNNISESLFKAIDIITSKRLTELEFDKTIIATITDTTNAAFGDYVLTDGATTFHAYSSDVSYKTGTNVYVTVPNGDFSKQKQILGKYVADEEASFYNYVSPFDKFVDITGDLCDEPQEVSLIANGTASEALITNIDIPAGKDFTRLGIKADFQAWLKNYNVIDGNYGIRIDVVSSEPTTTTTNNLTRTYRFYLDCKDMIGNPYNFDSYYTQEKVFDFSHIQGKIQSAKAYFYQSRNFIDNTNTLIPDASADNEYLNVEDLKNLFVSNIKVSFGYDISEYTEDTVLLYTLDSMSYNNSSLPEKNQKTLMVRWIQVTPDGIFCIDDDLELPKGVEIHWYRYELTTQEHVDELAGPFWHELAVTRNLSYVVNPDTSEPNQNYKVVIKAPIADSPYDEYQTLASEVLTLISEVPVADKATANLIRGLHIKCDEEGYNGVYLLYDDTNVIQNSNDATKARTLTAEWSSVSTGDETLDNVESILWRIPLFNTMIDEPRAGREYDLTDGMTAVYWEYVDDKGDLQTVHDEATKSALENGGTRFAAIYIKRMPNIKSAATSDAIGAQTQWTASQEFRIKSYYMESATNNIVKCYVRRDNIGYEGACELTFGPRGSNGTDFTFRMEFDDTIPALTKGDTSLTKINISMFDYNNDEVPKFYQNGIQLSWYATDDTVEMYASDGVKLNNNSTIYQPYFYVKLKNANSTPYYNIIQAMVKADPTANGGEAELKAITLKTLMPIPYRSNKQYTGIEGATNVVYSSSGTNPKYYKEVYRLWKDTVEETGVSWSISRRDTSDGSVRYYPRIQKNVIIVPSLYLDGLDTRICAVARKNGTVVWTQPIAMSKDLYASAYLNSWDGELTIDENNGIILSTVMGAGIKEQDNTFSGVMLGDVKDIMDSTMKIGLYGFNHGEQSFGWKVDGTGFIGKAGKGQIVFDGNRGTIQSGVWSASNGTQGMMIDLDGTDGKSSLLKAKGGGGSFELNTSESAPNLLKITDGADQPNVLFLIQTEENADDGQWDDGEWDDGAYENGFVTSQYYLQSSQYSAGKKGARLDLQNGKFTSYGTCGRVEIATNQETFFRLADGDNKVLFVIKTSEDNGQWDGEQGTSENVASDSAYYLQSAGYKAGFTGTRLDLQNGVYTSYGTCGRVEIATTKNSFFRLADGNNKDLFVIKTTETADNGQWDDSNKGASENGSVSSSYYLQSSQYHAGVSGTRLDLQNGRFTAYGDYGRVDIATNQSSFFRLADGANNDLFVIKTTDDADNGQWDNSATGESENPIVSSSYYLQSSQYKAGASGTRLDLQHGKFTSYGKAGRLEIATDAKSGTFFRVADADNVELFVIKTGDTEAQYQYYIQSANYDKSTKGTYLDLQAGKFFSYGKSGRLEISTNENDGDFFLLTDSTDKKNPLFVIRNTVTDSDKDGSDNNTQSAYYLQSANFKSGTVGTRLDLQNGKFVSFGPKGRLEIATGSDNTDAFFRLATGGTTANGGNKPLFVVKNSETGDDDGEGATSTYYLQSANFNTTTKLGTRLDLENGKYTSYGNAGRISMDTKGNIALHIQGYDTTESKFKSMMMISTGTEGYYLQSLDFLEHTETKEGKGFKLDLKNGKLIANTFELYAKNGNGYLKLGTADPNFAIDVNGQFKVDWIGNVTLHSNDPGNFTAGGVLTVESGLIISGKKRVDGSVFYEFNQKGGRIGPWIIDDKYIYCENATDYTVYDKVTPTGATEAVQATCKIGRDGTMWLNSKNVRLFMDEDAFILQQRGNDNNSGWPIFSFTPDCCIVENDQGSGLEILSRDAKNPYNTTETIGTHEPLCRMKVYDNNFIQVGQDNGIQLETDRAYITAKTGQTSYFGMDGELQDNAYKSVFDIAYTGSTKYINYLVMGTRAIAFGRHFNGSTTDASQSNRGLLITDKECFLMWGGLSKSYGSYGIDYYANSTIGGELPSNAFVGTGITKMSTSGDCTLLNSAPRVLNIANEFIVNVGNRVPANMAERKIELKGQNITLSGAGTTTGTITLNGNMVLKGKLNITDLVEELSTGEKLYTGTHEIKIVNNVKITKVSTSATHTHTFSGEDTASVYVSVSVSIPEGGGSDSDWDSDSDTLSISGDTGPAGAHTHTLELELTITTVKLEFKKGLCVGFTTSTSGTTVSG